MSSDPRGFSTRSVRGRHDPPEGPVALSIVPSSTFRFATIRDLAEANAGRARADSFYTRYGNPTIRALEEKLAALESAERALVFSSGMAAISAVFFAFLRPAARLVASRDLYGGTISLVKEVLAPWGVQVAWVDPWAPGEWERECARGAALTYVETPTNPLSRVVDLARVVRAAHAAGSPVACDATFASPRNQATLSFGVDLSIHSATKYLGGHSDLLGGTVAGSASMLERVETIRRRTGAVPDPEQAWRLERSLKTLALRVDRQCATALAIARFLEGNRAIERVHYPGLESHPDHAIARAQMSGFGGIVAFDVAGGEPAACRFAEALKLISIAPSLGGTESLICPPIRTSHASMPADERRRSGISDGALRLSVGVEDPEDLLGDLRLGLAAVGSA